MVDRVIPAVCEHIATEDALAGGDIGVGVDEAAYRRIVISALQVIEACFLGGRLARTLFSPLVGITKRHPHKIRTSAKSGQGVTPLPLLLPNKASKRLHKTASNAEGPPIE